MSCHHTRAVLDGQAPPVDVSPHLRGCDGCRAYADELDAVDAAFAELLPPAPPADLIARTLDAVEDAMDADEHWDFDALFAELPPPPVPPELAARTLRRVEAEMPAPRSRRWPWAAGLALAAAALLTVSLPGDEAADLSALTEKGAGVTLPELALEAAVSRGGAPPSRYRTDTRYSEGDIFYFRVSSDLPTTATLVRVDEQSVELVHQQPLAAGAVDLRRGEQLLAWKIEPGEQSADFVLLAGAAPQPEAISSALAADAPDPCAALEAALDTSCAQIRVEVAP